MINVILNKFSPNIIGIILMFGMVICVLVVASLVKVLGNNIDFRIVIAGRFFFSLPILYIVGWKIRKTDLFSVNSKTNMTFRVVVGSAGICFWFLAVRNADFGQVTALTQSATIFVAILAPFLLNEILGLWRFSAIIIGFLGIILITDPFQGSVSIGLVYALLAAITSALLSIILRKLGKSDEPITVAIWHNTIGFIAFSSLLFFDFPEVKIFNFNSILLLILLGVFGSLLQLFFTYAFKYGEAMILTPMRYISVPGAMVIGLAFWGEMPSSTQFFGAIITIGSCLVITWRELIKDKKNI